jgi:hypothetical protein
VVFMFKKILFLIFFHISETFTASAIMAKIPENWLEVIVIHMAADFHAPSQESISDNLKEEKILSLVRFYINLGADINKRLQGWTLLEWALVCENIMLVKYLISHGARLPISLQARPFICCNKEIEQERHIRDELQYKFMCTIYQLCHKKFLLPEELADLIYDFVRPADDKELMVLMAKERAVLEEDFLD